MSRSPEDESVPLDAKELLKSANIRVTQTRITGVNQFGRPKGEFLEERIFETFQKAFEWNCQNSQYLHNFQYPVPTLQIAARLIGVSGSEDEKLVVYSRAEKPGVTPRSVAGHHSVSTNGHEVSSINIELLPNQHSLFERGLAWFILEEEVPSLMVSVKPGATEPYKLQAGFLRMTARVVSVLDDLTKGKY